VAIEDSAHGVAAAAAAGMAVVAVPSRITRHNDLGQADLLVDSVERLTLADLGTLV
jgi:beta-phosphoglucomutase-like phosphatase (HAD superfamily)